MHQWRSNCIAQKPEIWRGIVFEGQQMMRIANMRPIWKVLDMLWSICGTNLTAQGKWLTVLLRGLLWECVLINQSQQANNFAKLPSLWFGANLTGPEAVKPVWQNVWTFFVINSDKQLTMWIQNHREDKTKVNNAESKDLKLLDHWVWMCVRWQCVLMDMSNMSALSFWGANCFDALPWCIGSSARLAAWNLMWYFTLCSTPNLVYR